MSWNYRTVRCVEPDGSVYYEIREAYYHDDIATHPWTITAAGARPGGETLLSLRKDLTLMLAAFDKSPLDDRAFRDLPRAEPLAIDGVAAPPPPQEPR